MKTNKAKLLKVIVAGSIFIGSFSWTTVVIIDQKKAIKQYESMIIKMQASIDDKVSINKELKNDLLNTQKEKVDAENKIKDLEEELLSTHDKLKKSEKEKDRLETDLEKERLKNRIEEEKKKVQSHLTSSRQDMDEGASTKGYKGWKRMVVEATGYSLVDDPLCCSGTGLTASGTKPRVGVIAVDPNVIPLGTKVYIPKFGMEYTAEDTGGMIKGNKIDIYMNHGDEARKWGRQNIEIFVQV